MVKNTRDTNEPPDMISHLLSRKSNGITKLPRLAVDLDAIMEKLLERRGVKYAVLHRDEAVDDKLHRLLLGALLRLRLYTLSNVGSGSDETFEAKIHGNKKATNGKLDSTEIAQDSFTHSPKEAEGLLAYQCVRFRVLVERGIKSSTRTVYSSAGISYPDRTESPKTWRRLLECA